MSFFTKTKEPTLLEKLDAQIAECRSIVRDAKANEARSVENRQGAEAALDRALDLRHTLTGEKS